MKQNQNLETTVGIFLMFGIGIICTLILFFGEVKGLLNPTYSLIVEFPNASGLLKGSDVYLSGAVIGKVTSDPQPVPDTDLVQVDLKIDSKIHIREGAKYVIGSSGLLGDRFVDVQPIQYPPDTPEDKKQPYVKDGALIHGTKSVGLDVVMESAEPLIQKANEIANRLNNIMIKLDDQVLTGTSTDDLKETIAKLREMVDNGDVMVKNANDLLSQAKQGKGPVGRLINDKQLGDNVAAFIANLKAHGPIFYQDDTAKDDDEAPAPTPRKQRK